MTVATKQNLESIVGAPRPAKVLSVDRNTDDVWTLHLEGQGTGVAACDPVDRRGSQAKAPHLLEGRHPSLAALPGLELHLLVQPGSQSTGDGPGIRGPVLGAHQSTPQAPCQGAVGRLHQTAVPHGSAVM